MSSEHASMPVTADEIRDGTLLASGVSSVVLDGTDDDPTAVGHVLLLDMDDVSLFQTLQEARQLDGVTAILESSPGSYHVWNLSVRPFDDQLVNALHTHTEPLHVSASAKRGRFILRCGPKYRVTADAPDAPLTPTEVYKGAPRVEAAWYESTDVPQSRPHLRLLEHLSGDDDLVDGVPDSLLVGRGDRVMQSEYLTLDDGTKKVV